MDHTRVSILQPDIQGGTPENMTTSSFGPGWGHKNPEAWDPKDSISIRIPHPGSEAQDKVESRNHGF